MAACYVKSIVVCMLCVVLWCVVGFTNPTTHHIAQFHSALHIHPQFDFYGLVKLLLEFCVRISAGRSCIFVEVSRGYPQSVRATETSPFSVEYSCILLQKSRIHISVRELVVLRIYLEHSQSFRKSFGTVLRIRARPISSISFPVHSPLILLSSNPT